MRAQGHAMQRVHRAILQNRKLAFLAGKKVSFSFFYAVKQVSFLFLAGKAFKAVTQLSVACEP